MDRFDLGSSSQGSDRKRRRKGTSRACSHCSRTFKRIEHLDRHVRTHTKEKPFSCGCGATYARRDLLTRHHRREGHKDDFRSSLNSVPRLGAGRSISIDDQDNTTRQGNTEKPNGVEINNSREEVLPGADIYSMTEQTNSNFQQFEVSPYCNIQPIYPFIDTDGELPAFDQFGQFAHVLGGLGLPDEWGPYFEYLNDSRDSIIMQQGLVQYPHGDGRIVAVSSAAETADEERPGTPFTAWLPPAPIGNRVSINFPTKRIEDASRSPNRWMITKEQRDELVNLLDDHRDIINPDFNFPSRHTLSRYLTSFFGSFNKNLPFIHHTWRPLDGPIELLLSLCAIGARECCETRISEDLFISGKTIHISRLRHNIGKFGPKTAAFLGLSEGSGSNTRHYDGDSISCREDHRGWSPVESIRAGLLLLCYTTWEQKQSRVEDGLGLASLLAQMLMDVGLDEGAQECNSWDQNRDWKHFIRLESTRRTKLSSISFLSTQSVAYNVFPLMRNSEVRLRLPCSQQEWDALGPSQWLSARREVEKPQLYYDQALSQLAAYNGSDLPLDPIPSSLGNYLLIHGLLQRIALVRDLSVSPIDAPSALPTEEAEKLERALRAWTVVWQQTPESSVDPSDDVGRIPSTSSAMLSLAYVRIHLNIGPYRNLETRDPSRIAEAIRRCPPVKRGDALISALLYATHSLSIPVRLGIDRVARVQVSLWTIRHSLAGLESAVMLSKWLIAVDETIAIQPLTVAESKIMYWIKCIIEEAAVVLDFDDENISTGVNPANMNLAVFKIWSYFFKRNTVFHFINTLGDSLDRYRDSFIKM